MTAAELAAKSEGEELLIGALYLPFTLGGSLIGFLQSESCECFQPSALWTKWVSSNGKQIQSRMR